jgi:diadenosine tetraphosphate (Ap4A) HIT family hydrolase
LVPLRVFGSFWAVIKEQCTFTNSFQIYKKIFLLFNLKKEVTMNNCIFCNIQKPILENDLAHAIFDKYPVNPGHLLIIPKRHIASLFETTAAERAALFELLQAGRELLQQQYQPNGFNVGINDGIAAGQTVMHLHIHLIPRFDGDIDNPRGGVRGVIPEKRIY